MDVVITPVEEFKVQFAWDAFVKTFVVSEKAIVESEEPAIVATVPEKLPAIVPNDPAFVEKLGAVEAVIIALALLPELPSSSSILT